MRISLRGVRAGYGGEPVLRGIDLEVGDGEFLAVIGPNGAGKTTLLRVIAGVVRPAAGEVLVDGRPISSLNPREIARKMGVVGQIPEARLDFRVQELVELGRIPHLGFPDRLGPVDRAAVRRALELVGLSGLAHRRLSTLSGGERRKAFIAVALARDPQALLLDEPTAHLDLKAQVELLRLFWNWSEDGVTVIATLHDLNLAATFARLVLLAAGRVLAQGPAPTVLTPQNIREAFGVEVRIAHDPLTGAAWVQPVWLPALSEQTPDLAGVRVDVDATVSGVRAGPGHEGDVSSHRAEKLGPGEHENVPDR